MVYDTADIERRLAAGEWLLIGEVAALLGIGRSTVHRLLGTRTIRHRIRPGTGSYRECHPDDVRQQLKARRTVHGE
jgi:DNA-binding transcriptional MerR regulator